MSSGYSIPTDEDDSKLPPMRPARPRAVPVSPPLEDDPGEAENKAAAGGVRRRSPFEKSVITLLKADPDVSPEDLYDMIQELVFEHNRLTHASQEMDQATKSAHQDFSVTLAKLKRIRKKLMELLVDDE